jgi:hypothetical protein
MAFLDISEVLLDPDFTDNFVVTRRLEVVGTNGRSNVTQFTKPTFGVVTAAGRNELERVPDADTYKRIIVIVTKFPLQGEVTLGNGITYKPDLVVWRGNNYLVKECDLYPQFGAGFVQAICTSEDIIDTSVFPYGGMLFNQKSNSSYLGAV